MELMALFENPATSNDDIKEMLIGWGCIDLPKEDNHLGSQVMGLWD